MYYALTVNANQIITGVHSGLNEILQGHFYANPEYAEDIVIPISNPAEYRTGVDFRCYTVEGILQSEVWLIENGYLEMPKEKRIIDGVLIDWYSVYVTLNKDGYIGGVSSDAHLDEADGWIKVDGGTTDKYRFAEKQYLEKPLIVTDTVYQYKLLNGQVVERTTEEIATDIAAIPPKEPTEREILMILLGVE